MEFTEKKLVEILEISQQALSKALKHTPNKLKSIEGSTKKVKHYKAYDLPDRYKDKLKEKGFEIEKPKEDDTSTNNTPAKFTEKYLTASPDKQRKAVEKVKFIEAYLRRDKSLTQIAWLEMILKESIEFDNLGKISQKQLNDWLRKYREAKSKGLNVVEAFIDSRGAKKGVKALNDKQQEMAIRYFIKPTRPKITEIHRNMCHVFGDTMPSYDALNNFYKSWQKENPILAEFAKSPDSAKNKFLAAYGDMSAKARYRNHYWELDSTPADVICEDGKRYAIIAALDIHTRRVVFHVCESSSSYTISQLLRKAILKLGIPENVVIDNGKDYTSNHFQSVCLNLGIEMNIVPPFSGECKPHVERVFETLSSELFEQVPGYIGHNVAQRAEIQAKKSFADKIESQRRWREEFSLKSDEEKKLWKDAWKLKKENLGLELNVLLSAEELQYWCDNWANKLYETRTHSSIKTSPIKKWDEDKTPVQSIPDERMLDLLLGESVTRRVGKKGIAYDGCQYAHIDLVEYTGQHVYVMASSDMGYILVYDSKMSFICIAEDLEHMGLDRYQVRGARKKSLALMRQLDKIVKEAQAIDDISIMDRIESIESEIGTPTTTYAIPKRTEAIDRLLKDSPEIAKKDAQELEKSNKYDFKNKDEEGKPVKVHQSGRPKFETFTQRFLWCLEHDEWNDKDVNLKDKKPNDYERALEIFEKRKTG